MELQNCSETGTLFVQVHTGSRGFGHGLATNYFQMARDERPDEITDLDLGYFTPESSHFNAYLNAVAAGGANVVSAGGANVVSAGGANVLVPVSGVVAAGGLN